MISKSKLSVLKLSIEFMTGGILVTQLLEQWMQVEMQKRVGSTLGLKQRLYRDPNVTLVPTCFASQNERDFGS